MSNKIDVLDHGYVRLVDSMGDDLSIVRSARVSYDADWRGENDDSKDMKLLKYMLFNKHTSPFESVEFQFEIKCPIFIARQWMRHRTWSYNEVSARYTELPSEYYVPLPEIIGKQSATNKQAREISAFSDPYDRVSADVIREAMAASFEAYERLLRRGVPRELARSVLPVGTYTRFFAKVNLKNLLDFLRLRDDSHAQYEIQLYAKAIKELIRPVVPITMRLVYETDN